MGTGQTQLAAEQVANHGFSAGQGIHAAALAVGREGFTVWVVGEAGHHGDRRSPGGFELPASPQQCLRLAQLPPTHATGPKAEAYLQRPIGDHRRPDLQAQGGAATIGHLQMALPQLRLDAGIEQQPHPLPANRLEQQLPRREAIKAGSLHVVDPRITPIERRPIQHIGMGDQAAAGRRQQPRRRQGVTGVATHLTADAGGDHQQGGQGWSRTDHASTTSAAPSLSTTASI